MDVYIYGVRMEGSLIMKELLITNFFDSTLKASLPVEYITDLQSLKNNGMKTGAKP